MNFNKFRQACVDTDGTDLLPHILVGGAVYTVAIAGLGTMIYNTLKNTKS